MLFYLRFTKITRLLYIYHRMKISANSYREIVEVLEDNAIAYLAVTCLGGATIMI